MTEVKIGNTNITTDGSTLDKNIRSIVGRSAKLAGETHVALVSGMWHAREHGDTTRLTALVGGLHSSNRKQGIVAWLNKFMPVTDEGVNAKSGEMKLRKDRKPEDFQIEQAEAVPYWDFTVEKPVAELTLPALLKLLNTKFGKNCAIPDTSRKAILSVVQHEVELAERNAAEQQDEPAATGTEG